MDGTGPTTESGKAIWEISVNLIYLKSTASGRATRRASERSGVYKDIGDDRFSLWEGPAGQEGEPKVCMNGRVCLTCDGNASITW